MQIRFILISVFLFSCGLLFSQEYNQYENFDYSPYTRYLYKPGTNFHTSVRNYRMDEVEKIVNTDSVLYDGLKIPAGKLNFWKRIVHDDLFRWKSDDIKILINPLFNFGGGYETDDGRWTYTNTRGVFVKGNIGKYFSFYTDFVENQATFPNYVDEFAREYNIVPGQGKRKDYKETGHDYAQATGYVSFNMAKYFNLQLGYGKNFIGDGYRSLIMSDVAFSYPYLKFTTTFWKIKYMFLWNKMLNLERDVSLGDTRYPVKYSANHYLDWNIGKRFSMGLFVNVVWAQQDTVGYRGVDFSYLIPGVFVRPVEYSNGSPDNVTMALNLKYIVAKQLTVYGQFVMGEFKADEVFSGEKWWANKHGFQIGLKTFDLFNVKNLDIQAEYNQVRPYTYSHYTSIYSYAHYNQPMAHLLGANFSEGLFIARYRYRRLMFKAQMVKSMYGDDYGDGVSWGKNVLMPNTQRPSDYGIYIGQGLKTNVFYTDMSVSFLVNPRNMWNVVAGVQLRNLENEQRTQNTNYFYFGVRTSLKNLYYDF